MFKWVLGRVFDFAGGKVVSGIVEGYKAKLEAGNDSERIAAELAGRELIVQTREMELQTQLRIEQTGRWYTPENLFAYVLVIYFAKCILFDKVVASLFSGNIFLTDAITGELLAWAGAIMIFLFGKRGFENIARILKR
jgi:hypothetical protein